MSLSTSYEDGEGLEIAIIGMAGRFPGARNIQIFWQNLCDGKETVTFFSDEELVQAGVDPTLLKDPNYVKAGYVLEDRDLFDASFFGYSTREAEIIDPQQRLFLECAWEALEDAGHDPATYKGLIGTYAGAGISDYLWRNVAAHPEELHNVSDYQLMLGSDKDYLATRVAYKLNLRGPALTVQTACSSSLVAVHLACQGLLNGECDMALAGGSCVDTSPRAGYLYQEEGIRSPDGHCRAFDAEAKGSVGSSGLGLVILKRLSDALADGNQIYAVIKGSAINNDGAQKVSFTAPGVDGQAQVIRAAHIVAEVDADSISYVETHGTGTPLGDPIEIAALNQAFSYSTDAKGFCAIGSVKTNIGHLDVAAGITGLIKTALMLKHRMIPPSLHYEQPNPKIDFANSPFYVNTKLTEWKTDKLPRRAGVSSFGIGGTNAHVVLEEAPISEPAEDSIPWHLLVLSARTDTALERMTDNLATYLQEHPHSNLADVAYTLQVGRQHFSHRRMLVCQDYNDALQALIAKDNYRLLSSTEYLRDRPVVFLFPGQGAQYAYMTEELYRLSSTFRQHVDRCCELLKPHLECDLRDVLYPEKRNNDEDTQRLQQTLLAQPALFVTEYALSKTWMDWGVKPSAMLGHSVGEYVAACLAEVFSLEDALRVIAARGRLAQALPTGAMLAVELTEDETRALLNDRLSLAAINGPSRCVVAGPTEDIVALEQRLSQQGIVGRVLHTSHAFHSTMMEPMIEPFIEVLKTVQLRAPKIPYVSNLTGTWIIEAETTDPHYWARQLRHTVRFSEGSATILQKPNSLLLEVGPGRTLSSRLRQHPAKTPQHVVLASLDHRQNDSDMASLLRALGQIWLAGGYIAWDHLYNGESRQRIALPTYPFERKRYWLVAPQVPAAPLPSRPLDMESRRESIASSLDTDSGRNGQVHHHEGNGYVPQTTVSENQELYMSEHTVQERPASQREATIAALLRADFSQLLGENLESMDPATTFLEMGADSLSLLQANQVIQHRFGVKIPFRLMLDEYPTIDALAALIDQKLPAEKTLAGTVPPEEKSSVLPNEVNHPTNGVQASPEVQPAPTHSNGAYTAHVTPVAGASANGIASDQTLAAPVSVPGGFDGIFVQQLQAMSQVITQQLEVIRAATGTPTSSSQVSPQKNHAPSIAEHASLPQAQEEHDPAHGATSNGVSSAPSTNGKAFIPYKPVLKKSSFDLSPQQQKYLTQFIDRYTQRTQGSKNYARTYHTFLADSRWVKGLSQPLKEMVYPLVVQRAQGAHVWDMDNHEYIDTAMGFGSLLFGHSPSFITETLEQQLKQGIRIGIESEMVGKAARLLCEITGNERATFCNSGTEAVMMALRIARAVTGRQKIALFVGSYHGTFDGILVVPKENAQGELSALPMAPGVVPHMVEDVILLQFGQQEALESIRKHSHELAAVLVEPLQSRRPDLVLPEFLRALRQLTTAHDIALIFDEVVTGFRVHPRGIQALVDVQADITTYGKAMGGGLPIAAVAGKATYMDALDGGQWNYGDASFPEATETFVTGTYFKHPLLMPVVLAILNHIQERGLTLQHDLQQRTTQMVERLNRFCERVHAPVRLVNFSSLYRFVFSPEVSHIVEELFFYHMIYKGVYIWEGRNCFLSTAHTAEDVEKIVQAVQETILDMRRGGFFPDPTGPSSGEPADGLDTKQPADTSQQRASQAAGNAGRMPTGEERIPLTDAQKELWIMAHLGEDSACAYNEVLALRLQGPLQIQALQDALQELVNRHDALRTTFSSTGEHQLIASSAQAEIHIQDYSSLEREQAEARLAAWVAQERERPFDLEHGPLFRAYIITLEKQSHLLVLMYHHIVIDGWSCGTLLEEISALYEANCLHVAPALPQPMQYSDYVHWQRDQEQQGALAEAEAYWLEQFTGDIPVLALPLDHPRPTYKTYTGARERLVISAELGARLEKLGAHYASTLLNVLLTGFRILLHRLTGQQDVVVGTPAAGQSAAEGEQLVGHCVNLLPIRTHLNDNATFVEYLTTVKRAVLEAYEHQMYPFFKLVNKLNAARDASRTPLISTTFNLDILEEPVFFGLETSVDKSLGGTVSAKFDIDVNIIKQKGSSTRDSYSTLEINWDYNADLFDASTMQSWIKQFVDVLETAVTHPGDRISTFAIAPASNKPHPQQVSEEERKKQLLVWNATRTPYPADRCIHQLFEEQADRHPQAQALLFGAVHMSYEQLNQQANQLAHYLHSLHVCPGSLVGLYLERDADMIVATLAILKAGAAYVPLDLAYPQERIAFMVRDTGMRAVVTSEALSAKIMNIGTEALVIALDRERERLSQESTANLPCELGPDSLAYVIYTSGSTGTPKGVTIPHRAVNRLVCETNYLQIVPEDRVAQASNASFDAATFEIWGALLNGACLVGVPKDVVLSPQDLTACLHEQHISVLFLTTALFNQMAQEAADPFRGLRCLLVGGEALTPGYVRLLLEHGRPQRLLNAYGPTENTTYSAYHEVEQVPAEASTIPIGKPIANSQCYVLNEQMELLPVGTPGELYLGGAGLAQGYLARPELTAERFVPHPFSSEPGARLYKTGDIAKVQPDGVLEFIGRKDQQVKIHGFRIELGEIEAMLAKHPSVRDAVVLAREDRPGEKRLIAYVVPEPQREVVAQELRTCLEQQLPAYMVPTTFMTLEALPLTPNGKVDRRALPVPPLSDTSKSTSYVAPSTPAEQILTEIWQQVLGREHIGVQDNFFELGGDSILGISIISRANQAGLSLRPKQLFLHQTIASLAAASGMERTVATEQKQVQGRVPLTPIQRWFFEQKLAEPSYWTMSLLLEVKQTLDTALLEQAFAALVQHHDVLRLHYFQDALGWQQEIAVSGEPRLSLQHIDLSHLPPEEKWKAMEDKAMALRASLDLSQAPLLRLALFTLGPTQAPRLFITIHHLLIDIVSWRILLEDLQTAYQQLQQGQSVRLPDRTTSFQRWATLLSGYAQAEQLREEYAYWRELVRAPLASLPLDHTNGENTVGSTQTIEISLEAQQTQALVSLVPRVYRMQVSDVLLAALVLACESWTGQRRLLIDLESHGREDLFEDVDLSRTVGWFTVLAPVMLDLEGLQSVDEILQATRESLRRRPRGGIGYGVLRYLSTDETQVAQLKALPQAQISFNYMGQSTQALTDEDLFSLANESTGPNFSPRGKRSYLLDVNSIVTDGQLRVHLTYSEALHEQTTIRHLAERYIKVLQELIDHAQSQQPSSQTITQGRSTKGRQKVNAASGKFSLAGLDQQKLSSVLSKVQFFKEGE